MIERMKTLEELPVAIVGAGPCGLLTALLLARAGVPCRVLEKHPGISTHPKAMGITRRTAEIYRQCGFLDEMMAPDFQSPDLELMIWAKSLTGEEFGRAPLPPMDTSFSPCRPFHVPQTHTETVLLNALAAEPLASVHFQHRVTGLRQLPQGVELDIEAPDEKKTTRAEWVVAADGAASPIRNLLGIGADGPGDLGHFLNVFFHADFGRAMAGRRALLYNILREDLVEFFVSVNGRDLWLMHHFLRPDEPTPDENALHSLICSASGLPDPHVKILGVAPWVMSPKVASRFREHRVLLTGDASARLSPAGGMGMNNGLQAAHNLAWKLAAVVQGSARETLLDSYESERRALSLAVMRHTNENSSEVFKQVHLALEGDWQGLRQSIGRSHRQAEDRSFDTGVHYGTAFRFPHAPLSSPGSSTLDLFGQGFAVVAGSQTCLSGPGLPPVTILESFPDGVPCGPSGAVLVRPDGFLCWSKAADVQEEDIRQALAFATR